MFEIQPEHLTQDFILQLARHYSVIAAATKKWVDKGLTWEQAMYYIIIQLLQQNKELSDKLLKPQNQHHFTLAFTAEERDQLRGLMAKPSTLSALTDIRIANKQTGITEEQAYERLGLMPPDQFAQQATNPPRNTGRTTQMLVRAVVQSQYGKVAIVGRRVQHTRDLIAQAKEMCFKLRLMSIHIIAVGTLGATHPEAIRRQFPDAWVFVDNERIGYGLFERVSLPQPTTDRDEEYCQNLKVISEAKHKLWTSDAVRGRRVEFAIRLHPDDFKAMLNQRISPIKQVGAGWTFEEMELIIDGECDRGEAKVVEHLEEEYPPLSYRGTTYQQQGDFTL